MPPRPSFKAPRTALPADSPSLPRITASIRSGTRCSKTLSFHRMASETYAGPATRATTTPSWPTSNTRTSPWTQASKRGRLDPHTLFFTTVSAISHVGTLATLMLASHSSSSCDTRTNVRLQRTHSALSHAPPVSLNGRSLRSHRAICPGHNHENQHLTPDPCPTSYQLRRATDLFSRPLRGPRSHSDSITATTTAPYPVRAAVLMANRAVSYTHLRAHET